MPIFMFAEQCAPLSFCELKIDPYLLLCYTIALLKVSQFLTNGTPKRVAI